ncbi:MAG: DMT family transporter, partial [Solirubrobacteraceae bacterium]|nr:DMT family transporter [Solirubrobacteraceae bacterium]
LFTLIGLIGPVRATAITYVNPAVAIVAGVLFLDEAVTGWTVLGFGLVLVGSYLLTRRPTGDDEPDLASMVGPEAASVYEPLVGRAARRYGEPRLLHVRLALGALDLLGERRGGSQVPRVQVREPLTGRRWD